MQMFPFCRVHSAWMECRNGSERLEADIFFVMENLVPDGRVIADISLRESELRNLFFLYCNAWRVVIEWRERWSRGIVFSLQRRSAQVGVLENDDLPVLWGPLGGEEGFGFNRLFHLHDSWLLARQSFTFWKEKIDFRYKGILLDYIKKLIKFLAKIHSGKCREWYRYLIWYQILMLNRKKYHIS